MFDQPRNGRAFFEALVADNLDLGRPEQIELIFGRKILPSTPGVFATRVVTRGVDVTVNVGYKHSRTKQYFKEGRALRIETVVNDPTDLGVLRRLVHLPELQANARDVNRRLLDHEHVGQGCVLASPAFERIARPSLVDGRRAPALRFGDPRVQALAGALAITAHLIGGFTNRSLRPLVATARPVLQPGPLLLRPAPAPTQRPDHPTGAFQHLRADRQRATLRRLLHQGPQPAAPTTARRRPPPAPLEVRQALKCSTGPSPTTSTKPASPPEESAQVSNP